MKSTSTRSLFTRLMTTRATSSASAQKSYNPHRSGLVNTTLFFIAAVALLFQVAAHADENVLPVEAYGKLPDKSLFAISPSGELIAYRNTNEQGDMVMIVNAKTKKLVDAVNVSEVDPRFIYFVDEDKVIMRATQNTKFARIDGRHELSVAFVYNLREKEVYQLLIPGKEIFSLQTGVGKVVGVSKDKKYAYMPAFGSQTIRSLFRVRLDKKSPPKLHQRGTADVIDFFMDGDGEVIARERYNNKNDKHSVEARIDDEWVEIFSEKTDRIYKSFSGVTPDRKSLVMLYNGEDTERTAYYTMSLADGTISDPIFSYDDKDIESVITDINRVVYGVRFSGFKPTYEFFDKKLNARLNGIAKALPEFSVRLRDFSPDWNNILLYSEGEMNAGSYLSYSNGQLTLLAQTRPAVPNELVNTVVEYEYKARDGMVIPTLLTVPKGKTPENLPAIMMPHGGPASYDKIGFDYMAQFFANRGYLVIQPQFRGSDGFGAEHLVAGYGEWGRKMQDDLTDAVSNLVENGVVDAKRVCIVGASYGGYATLAGAAFTPDVYACAISINGVSDIEEMMRDSERRLGDGHWVTSYWEDNIGGGKFDENHLWQISPANFAQNVKAPVLLIHGENDRVVPFEQSEIMYEKLKKAGKTVELVELPRGNHYLSKAENRMTAMKAMDAFIQKHM